jgi:hypothetical protein
VQSCGRVAFARNWSVLVGQEKVDADPKKGKKWKKGKGEKGGSRFLQHF